MQNDLPKFSDYIVGTMRLGQWGAKMNSAAYDKFIRRCIELGCIDFDHADIYGDYTTESEFGQILKKGPSLRKKMQITTKCGIRMLSENRPYHAIKSYDTSPQHIVESVENSLKNLSTDYIDILLIHRPDILLNADEVAETIMTLKGSGKVLHFGVSNFTTSQYDLLNDRILFCTNQVEASVLHLDPFHDGTFDQLQKLKIQPTIWSPFAGGKLFAKEKTERATRIFDMANGLCEKYDCDIDVLLLAWLKKHPSHPVPVLGTTKIERIEKYMNAKIKLSGEDWYKLYVASIGKKVA